MITLIVSVLTAVLMTVIVTASAALHLVDATVAGVIGLPLLVCTLIVIGIVKLVKRNSN